MYFHQMFVYNFEDVVAIFSSLLETLQIRDCQRLRPRFLLSKTEKYRTV